MNYFVSLGNFYVSGMQDAGVTKSLTPHHYGLVLLQKLTKRGSSGVDCQIGCYVRNKITPYVLIFCYRVS